MPNIITALLPAFAAGFAVQRLLEIADPILERWLKERKRYYLALLSLAFGFGIAAYAKLRVLIHLFPEVGNAPPNVPGPLDFIVTGLIISAGTEGFNSILKFLSYKKEEKKAESLLEKLSTRKALLGESLESAGLKSFSMATVMTDDPADLTLVTPEDIMKEALRDRVRRLKKNPALNLDFKNGKFSQHMANDQDAQQVTVEATEAAAPKFQRALNGEGRQIIRQSITVGTKYSDAIGVMEKALTEGADPVVVV
jgi:hypothetical protein